MNVAKLRDLTDLEELASKAGLPNLSRFIDHATRWTHAGDKPSEMPDYFTEQLAAELADFLPKLPNVAGFDSEVEFAIGYKPVVLELLPEIDADELRKWQGFYGQVFRNSDVKATDAMTRHQIWTPLIQDLATFLAKRRLFAKLRRTSPALQRA